MSLVPAVIPQAGGQAGGGGGERKKKKKYPYNLTLGTRPVRRSDSLH